MSDNYAEIERREWERDKRKALQTMPAVELQARAEWLERFAQAYYGRQLSITEAAHAANGGELSSTLILEIPLRAREAGLFKRLGWGPVEISTALRRVFSGFVRDLKEETAPVEQPTKGKRVQIAIAAHKMQEGN